MNEIPQPGLNDWVRIGQIGSPHGVHGELKLYPLSDVPGRFQDLKKVFWIGLNNKVRELHVIAVRPVNTFWLIRFKDIESPEKASELTRGYIALPETERGTLPEGVFFIDDIVGLLVEDESGSPLGKVIGVYQTGAQDLYEIQGQGMSFMLPAAKRYILAIDLKLRKMCVHVPEGLRE